MKMLVVIGFVVLMLIVGNVVLSAGVNVCNTYTQKIQEQLCIIEP